MSMQSRVLKWEELTSAKLEKLDKEIPVVIPVTCDAEFVERFCRGYRRVLLAPEINYSMTIGQSAFTSYVRNVIQSIKDNKFQNLIVASGCSVNDDVFGSGATDADLEIYSPEYRTLENPMDAFRYLDQKLPIVIPTGCIEDHAHLPVGCDSIAASNLAVTACKRTGAILAPAVNYGITIFEGGGDIPIEIRVFKEYANQIVKYFYKRLGFEKIILVNGHGGNTDVLEVIAAENYSAGVRLGVHEWWEYKVPACWRKIIQDGGHADWGETALMLALKSNLINTSQIKDPYPVRVKKPWYYLPSQMTVVDGHPSRATPKEGKEIYKIVLDNLVNLIEMAKADA